MKLAVALGCREWHSFRESGTGMHGADPSGTGVGIKIGIKDSLRGLPGNERRPRMMSLPDLRSRMRAAHLHRITIKPDEFWAVPAIA